MRLESKIYVAGHRGLVGSALLRGLRERGYRNLITRSHGELDLEHQIAVDGFFAHERPQYVLLAAAKVGGILANSIYPVDFLLRNLRIESNVIEASWRYPVEGLLFLGSSCIYPRLAPQPIKEDYVLTGLLEATNEPYALAKIAGIELCEAYNRQYGTRFLSVMPANLYGPNDNYDLETSHVLPALIRKFHLAKLAMQGDWSAIRVDERVFGPIPADFCGALSGSHQPEKSTIQPSAPDKVNGKGAPIVRLWGTGLPRREFLFSDDLADACIFLMNQLDDLFGNNPPFSTQQSALGTQHGLSGQLRKTVPSHHSSLTAERCSYASHHLINIGCGEDLTISELAKMVAGIVGYEGPVEWDCTKPDGTPRKLLEVSRITNLGWKPKTSLEEGIRRAYQDYLHKGES
jgi:GDP-L-fucose synthase